MSKSIRLAWRAALALLAVFAPAAAEAASTPPIVNVMPAYWAFRAQATASREAQVAALRQQVLQAYPRLYGPFVSVPGDGDLADWLGNMAPLEPEMRRLEPLILAEIARGAALLTRAMGPAPDMHIYVAPSLFTSNGQVRWLDRRPVVLFGVDVQAYAERELMAGVADKALGSFIAHELFHAHHYAMNPEIAAAAELLFSQTATPPLYLNLWIEGLATCAARRIAGGGVERALMMEGLHARVGPLVPRLAGELGTRLESTDRQDRITYFWLNEGTTAVPSRSAYAMGMLVADEVLKQRSLVEAARLSGPGLQAAIAEALGRLAQGSFDGNWDRVCVAAAAAN
jgi:hypothetical protein